ncbi:nuclear transport factor 2 family protein [Croceitalea rosinachiae]|uniref:Nuclear transport factor 2 family protein n=1 Tax=Croceitalea rosinachiae TaxID=3075596 RepID=A0ABU3A7U8_9FLAO|nr:nuclear transport factor 2 family protein [Croceitalea sp. F388]MDT0606014.1 nuclear transport factor 2 family protein [Croceitalea sp. F388]
MRFFRILLTIALAFNLSNCSDKEPETTKEKLLQAIDMFNKAFQDGDNAVLESMVTENYVHTNGNSKPIGKEDWFNYLNEREDDIKSGNLQVMEYELSERRIEFYGNVAIVTGKISVSNKKKEGIQKNEYRITNIWVNEKENWKRAGFHDGKIK